MMRYTKCKEITETSTRSSPCCSWTCADALHNITLLCHRSGLVLGVLVGFKVDGFLRPEAKALLQLAANLNDDTFDLLLYLVDSPFAF